MLNPIPLFILVTSIAVGLWGCASTSPRSDQFRPVILTERLPDGYDSYTVLLFPDYRTKYFYGEADIKMINESFKFFGEAIGKTNVAAIFLNADKKTHSVERAMGIVDNINRHSTRRLDYSSAPIIIYSDFNPDKVKPENGFVTAIAFRGAEPAVINGVVTRLTQLIRESRKPALEYEEISLRIETFMKHIKAELNLWDIIVLRYD